MTRQQCTFTLAVLTMFSAGITAQAQPFAPFGGHSDSDTQLGIYAFETPHGMQIAGTVKSCSAYERLLPGDVLLRATAPGLPCLSIKNHHRLEYAKRLIGANREAVIEFFRPGVGTMYAWVTFEITLPTTAWGQTITTLTVDQPLRAAFILESEKPGACDLFKTPVVIPAVTTTTTEVIPVAPTTIPAPSTEPTTPEIVAPKTAEEDIIQSLLN